MLAAAAGLGGLIAPASARAQDSPGRAQSLRAVVRLSPMAISQLPLAVRRGLIARRCTVPQTPFLRMPHNVLQGRFIDPRHRDWAVLCSPKGRDWAHVLVFHRGSARRVDSLAGASLSSHLEQRGNRWLYVRSLSRANPAEIRQMAKRHADPLPRCLDHDGLIDALGDDTSTAWYRLHGRWRDLGISGTLSDGYQAAYARPCVPAKR
jgi:hypothetical protein